jgi:hypothetical protein
MMMPHPINLMISAPVQCHGYSGRLECRGFMSDVHLYVYVYFSGTPQLNVAKLLLVQLVRWVGYADPLMTLMNNGSK